jgi:hypothetical protein
MRIPFQKLFNGMVSQREVAWRCIHVLSEAFIERDAAIRVSRPLAASDHSLHLCCSASARRSSMTEDL